MGEELAMKPEMAAYLAGLAQKHDDKEFALVAVAGDWLPRLSLCGGNSDLAKEGKVPMGQYAMVNGKDVVVLGASVDCFPLAWRPKAMSMTADGVVSNFDPTSDQFKDLAAKSEIQDSGCMFGPEFLLWVPEVKRYITFMMGSKSSRREAPNLKGLIAQPTTLKVTLLAGKKFKWHNPVIVKCSTPFAMPSDLEELKSVKDKFENPPKTPVVEKVDPVETGAARAR